MKCHIFQLCIWKGFERSHHSKVNSSNQQFIKIQKDTRFHDLQIPLHQKRESNILALRFFFEQMRLNTAESVKHFLFADSAMFNVMYVMEDKDWLDRKLLGYVTRLVRGLKGRDAWKYKNVIQEEHSILMKSIKSLF